MYHNTSLEIEMNSAQAYELSQLLEPNEPEPEPIGCVQLMVKDQYGRQTFHPHNQTAQLFASLAGTKTLTAQSLNLILKLGYVVEYIHPEVHIA